MSKTIDFIKDVCKKYNITYSILADEIGISESTMRSCMSTGKISKQTITSVELFLRIKELESELEDFKTLKRILKV